MLALPAPAAHAERLDQHDPKGDVRSYDIAKVVVKHRAQRVRFEIDAYDSTPDDYHVFVDRPGGKSWEYVVLWSVYSPRALGVMTRKQWASGGSRFKCDVRSGHETRKNVTFSIPTRCFKHPKKLRVTARSEDDEFGYKHRPHWTRWIHRA